MKELRKSFGHPSSQPSIDQQLADMRKENQRALEHLQNSMMAQMTTLFTSLLQQTISSLPSTPSTASSISRPAAPQIIGSSMPQPNSSSTSSATLVNGKQTGRSQTLHSSLPLSFPTMQFNPHLFPPSFVPPMGMPASAIQFNTSPPTSTMNSNNVFYGHSKASPPNLVTQNTGNNAL